MSSESERQRFEAWADERAISLKVENDGYRFAHTQFAWEAWQQAGAATGREAELRALAAECDGYAEVTHQAMEAACREGLFWKPLHKAKSSLEIVAVRLRAILDAAPPSPSAEYQRGLRDAARACVDFEMALREHPAEFRETFDNPGGDAAEAAKIMGDRLDALAEAAAGGAGEGDGDD